MIHPVSMMVVSIFTVYCMYQKQPKTVPVVTFYAAAVWKLLTFGENVMMLLLFPSKTFLLIAQRSVTFCLAKSNSSCRNKGHDVKLNDDNHRILSIPDWPKM